MGLTNEIGYIGQTAVIFGAQETVLVNLNWQQSFNNGKTGILIGRYDPTDFMNVLGYANPWTRISKSEYLRVSALLVILMRKRVPVC